MMTIDGEMRKGMNGQPRGTIEHRARGGQWSWRACGAIVGLAGGVVVVFFGSALTAISWFTGAAAHVQTLGTVLLFLTIPLLILGAECLDLIDKEKEQAKESRFHDAK
jgi:hypothetical protein